MAQKHYRDKNILKFWYVIRINKILAMKLLISALNKDFD